ncbi:hypothetical protein AQF52_8060 [Streptomyces venezuelae]|uniref:hypothetical protein n=1 Tax=Streptomyces gardneri TaxID=66892 RepID=UPI0006BC6291|nr:hypothetical protein [Streptomyces gardneri]ALO13641.1 hypothetical protein AQF52_8060 [Streptomyces venezuelae]QPK50221.1 hypothetical protein H4W23_40405 [Streptomyces gardneri]WRK41828.1 hypothetical protein U0M97_40660 [Streptomyces venezuelae]CUM35579.1 hypothetical protein BN2537_123 [Streptomyces venezuelae]
MELVERALPGVVEEHADQAAESACLLADVVGTAGWSATAADDALTAIETLAGALDGIGPEVREVLVAVTAATSTARQRLGLPVEVEPVAGVTVVPAPGGRRPRRRGLGPGYQGIRAAG